jgi:hypothetical protein
MRRPRIRQPRAAAEGVAVERLHQMNVPKNHEGNERDEIAKNQLDELKSLP